MYVAVKGGEAAIEAAHKLLSEARRGDPALGELTAAQIAAQLRLGVDRVMAEGSLYDPELAAIAIKQARGDMIEAIFLLRAYRTTLPRFGYSKPIETDRMRIDRRISATYKDLPGGQVLGPTFDYTHRLIDPALAKAGADAARGPAPGAAVDDQTPADHQTSQAPTPSATPTPRVTGLLDDEGLIERAGPSAPPSPPAAEANAMADTDHDHAAIPDLTREPLAFPATRDLRLQSLARGDEGFLLALGYSTQRGYGRTHPFAGELRVGEVDVELDVDGLDFPVPLGAITLTECEMINQFTGSADQPAQFTRGYGLVFGHGERKAMAMALVDRALRTDEFGEEVVAPAQDEEFVLAHADNVQATGFVEHLKLPHYVDFQAELALVRQLRAEWLAAKDEAACDAPDAAVSSHDAPAHDDATAPHVASETTS